MSIFDLKTNTNELISANQGTNKLTYEQKPPSRDITGPAFPNGAIHIRWEVAGQKWWVPSKSYLRMRVKLSKSDGSILTTAEQIAPNMGLCANLFQSAEFRINDKTVSRISDFMPQIDALHNRMNKSSSWLKSIGASTNLWQPELQERVNLVSSNGTTARGEGTPVKTVIKPLELDIRVGTTLQYTTATKLLTFTDAYLPALGQKLNVGENIVFTADAVNGVLAGKTLKIKTITAINSITVEDNDIVADQAAVVADYTFEKDIEASRRVKEFELTWQPPLSIFKLGHALPTMKCELILNPQTSSVYKQVAVETALTSTNKVSGTDYDFSVSDMYMYINTLEAERVDNLTYYLDLESVNCQTDTMVGSSGFNQKNFDVQASTHALTVAYQDQRVNSDTRFSSSKFKAYDATGETQQELGLERFYLSYASQQQPSPDADPEFELGVDNTVQRYLETQLNTGGYFDSGGAETIAEYHKRGSYYHFDFPKDATDNSTRVVVNQKFNTNVSNMRALLFNHYRQTARIVVAEGQTREVLVEDN